MKNLIFVPVLCFLVLGCTTMGSVSKSVSKIDGKTTLSMSPAWVYGSGMKMSLMTSKKDKDKVFLTAYVMGLNDLNTRKPLFFRIDQEVKKISPDSRPSYETMRDGNTVNNWTKYYYTIDKKFLAKLVNGKEVYARIGGLEGEISTDTVATVRPGFKSFLAKIDTL